MAQDTIGQRIKFVIEAQKVSVRKFAQMLDISETNVRNYFDRGTKPSSDFIERLYNTFPLINLTWLITGQGEPFTMTVEEFAMIGLDAKSNQGQISQLIGTNHGTATQNTYSIADCEKERDALKIENEWLRLQLKTQEALIAAKEETISILRVPHHGSQKP